VVAGADTLEILKVSPDHELALAFGPIRPEQPFSPAQNVELTIETAAQIGGYRW
jgi:hypothetical protein